VGRHGRDHPHQRTGAGREHVGRGPARAHAAMCVYLAPILNGPKLTKPQDVNTPKATAAVAKALLDTALPELS
jgi:hypothetical protein